MFKEMTPYKYPCKYETYIKGSDQKIPCNQKFDSFFELEKHYEKSHSEGEKPFACKYCNQKFIFDRQKYNHEKKHRDGV